MALVQHEFYIYHDGPVVYGRKLGLGAKVVKQCASAQEAYDYVQSVINPEGRAHSEFMDGDIPTGFNSVEFQEQISPNCKSVVEAAYAEG